MGIDDMYSMSNELCWSLRVSTFRFVDVLVCRRFGLSTFRFVDVLVCQRFGLSTFWFVDVSVCRRFGLSTFWFVDVLVCRPFGCQRFGLSTFWLVTMHKAWSSIEKIPYFFFEVIHRVSRSHRTKKLPILNAIGRFHTVIPVWIYWWLWNDAQS